MRLTATSLRAEIAILSAAMSVAAAPLFAGYAEETGQEPDPPAETRPATHAGEPRLPSEKEPIGGRGSRLQQRRDWWNHAREVLFTDIQLSAEQAEKVDAIIAEQLDKRAQLQQRDAEYHAARKSRDPERIDAARAAFRAIRAQLEKPHEIYEELRAPLSEAQRPKFDMNRARLVAESQAPTTEPAAQTEQRDRAKSEAR